MSANRLKRIKRAGYHAALREYREVKATIESNGGRILTKKSSIKKREGTKELASVVVGTKTIYYIPAPAA